MTTSCAGGQVHRFLATTKILCSDNISPDRLAISASTAAQGAVLATRFKNKQNVGGHVLLH